MSSGSYAPVLNRQECVRHTYVMQPRPGNGRHLRKIVCAVCELTMVHVGLFRQELKRGECV